MSRYKATYVVCDTPGCEVQDVYPTRALSRPRGSSYDYCTEHYPLPTCEGCERKMRPFKARKEDWPDTMSRHTKTLCGSCNQRKERGRLPEFPGVDTRAAIDYVLKRSPDPYDTIKQLGLEAFV